MAIHITVPETTITSGDELDTFLSKVKVEYLKQLREERNKAERKKLDLTTYGLEKGDLVKVGKGTKVWKIDRIGTYYSQGYGRQGVLLNDAGTGRLYNKRMSIPLSEISRLRKA